MPIEHARITIYKIERCGFYNFGENTPALSSAEDTLQNLTSWVQGKTLAQTKTYEIADGDSELPTYCLNLIAAGYPSEYLLTTWNEVPSVAGNVASVSPNNTVGNATVQLSQLPQGNIPGFATYFWFLPFEGVFATILFQHRQNGHKSMVHYVKEYLAKFSPYVVNQLNGQTMQVLGYRADATQQPQNLLPQFKTVLYRNPGKIEYLLDNCGSIRKMIRKNCLYANVQDDPLIWQNLLRYFHISDPPNLSEEVEIKFELPFTPNAAQLQEVIDGWQNHHATKWDDVGFTLKGDSSKIKWLSNSIATGEFQLNVTRDNLEVVNSTSLLSQLQSMRQTVLGMANE